MYFVIVLKYRLYTPFLSMSLMMAYFSGCLSLGPFYVMMAPQDVLQSTGLGQRTLVPRSGLVPKLEPGNRVTRDDRRRATHNEGSLMLESLT